MKPKKKSRQCRGLGLDSGLDLAISRFIYSLGIKTLQLIEVRTNFRAHLPEVFRQLGY